MKFIYILTCFSITLLGCGKDHSVVIKKTKVVENPYDDTEITERLDRIEEKQELLETLYNTNVYNITTLEEQIVTLNTQLEELGVDSNNFKTEIVRISESLDEIREIAEKTVEVVQLCEDSTEALLRLEDNSIVAYFESGGNRHLTVLEKEVHYVTTDGSSCHFKITELGEIEIL